MTDTVTDGCNRRPGDTETEEPIDRDVPDDLAWAIEERVLDPYGVRIDLADFSDSTLRIVGIAVDEDPAAEHVELENPGDEPIHVGDWTLDVERDTDTGSVTETFAFGTDPDDVTVPPGGTLRVVPAVGNDTAETLFWDWDDSPAEPPLLVEATKVVLRNARGWPIGYRDLGGDAAAAALPPYRLASDVFDHWYPLKPQQTPGGFTEKDTTFALARLVDADVTELPTPKSRILREYVPKTADKAVPTIQDEELTRAGAEVTRSIQLARWFDGGTHMWSARQSGPGFGQGASGLRYDYLAPPDDERE